MCKSFLNNRKYPLAILSFLLFLLPGCRKDFSPLKISFVRLGIEQVGVTEVWLKLEMDNGDDGKEFSVKRDSETIFRGRLAGDDTTLHDKNLLPSHEYSYVAYRLANGKEIYSSELLKVTTMDTTSHEFSWEIYTFGGVRGSSVLRDVCIIDENDIWAVGEIHTEDTDCWNEDSTQWIPPYNAVHWNGVEWELIRTEAPGYGFGTNYSVFAFDSNNVWVGSGIPKKWDGNKWIFYGSTVGYPGGFRIYKIWGTSSYEIYFVGSHGNITHYDGSRWRKLEAPLGQDGTDLPIQDIWGSTDMKTGETTIFCVASEKYQLSDKKIIKIDSETHTTSLIEWPFQNRRIHSVWFKKKSHLWVCGAGVFVSHNGVWREFKEVPLIFTNRIRGNDINDIFVTGDFGIVAHWNGMSWRVYPNVEVDIYYSLAYKENVMVAVGQNAAKAIILKMKR